MFKDRRAKNFPIARDIGGGNSEKLPFDQNPLFSKHRFLYAAVEEKLQPLRSHIGDVTTMQQRSFRKGEKAFKSNTCLKIELASCNSLDKARCLTQLLVFLVAYHWRY
ncbi:hypothetical protein ASF69_20175 [Rhizobium sp. Leaf311]|nr:hypothetical protein ASF69_20175 [Rhizobium sp. Leaf311]